MDVQRLPNGNLLVPHRAEDSDGTVGDAMLEIGPDDPKYAEWLKWVDDDERKLGDAQETDTPFDKPPGE